MKKLDLRPWLAVGMVLLLLVGGACADDGTVPDPAPDPAPENPGEILSEPSLKVSPTVLRFDAEGKALDANAFVVATNGPWTLTIPEDAQNWVEASALSGNGDTEVGIRLSASSAYRTAELIFSTERLAGQTPLSQTVEVQQGTPSSDDDNPSNPDDSGDADDGDHGDDDDSGNSSGSNDPNEDENQDPSGDSGNSGSGDEGDDPDSGNSGNAGESGDPSDSKQDPEPEPEVPTVPQITEVTPPSLAWAATDVSVLKPVTVWVNVEPFELEVDITGPDADRFTLSPVRGGNVISVKNNGSNETAFDFTAELVISVKGGNSSWRVPLRQSQREETMTTPNPNEIAKGDDDDKNSDAEEKDSDGGRDDFASPNLPPNSDYMETLPITPDGWRGKNCAVFSGSITPRNSAPFYPALLGTSDTVKGLSMNGNKTRIGQIFSPELHGGCGTLSFDYGITEEGDEEVDFTVTVSQNNGKEVQFTVKKTVQCLQKYTYTAAVHLSGDFQIVFTNNCPPNKSKDAIYINRYTIFNIVWTGEK